MFENMTHGIQEDTLMMLFHLNIQSAPERKQVAKEANATVENADQSWKGKSKEPAKAKPQVGRNDPCPCGSGKKYKNCCGKNA